MPISDKFTRLPLDAILIDRESRQRVEIDVSDIVESVRTRGVLQPILVENTPDPTKFKLIAGERRLEASRQAGHLSIIVRHVEDLSPIELSILELEENLKRKDLTWQDFVRAVAKLHSSYETLDDSWTMDQTAKSISIDPSTITRVLRIWRDFDDPVVQASTSEREAYNKLTRRDQRKLGDALEELISGASEMGKAPAPASPIIATMTPELAKALEANPQAEVKIVEPTTRIPRAEDSILHTSFLEWAPKYSGPKFNILHCDFPYGVNLFGGEFGKRGTTNPEDEYSDSKDIYFALLECLLDNLDSLMSLSGHLLFWYSMKFDRETKELFRSRAPSLHFTSHPLIWGKSDNAGIIGDARRDPRHTYEVCLFARRGDRNVVKSVSDFYHAPTDKTLHPSAKPEPMLKHFLSMLVDSNSSLLDPTCGAGSALRAAEALGASRVLGLELDENHCAVARTALQNSRLLRKAHSTILETSQ